MTEMKNPASLGGVPAAVETSPPERLISETIADSFRNHLIEEFQLLELKDVLLVDVVSGSSKTLRRKMGQREAVLKELSQVANDHYFKVFFKSSRATKTITPESAFKAAHDPDSDEVVYICRLRHVSSRTPEEMTMKILSNLHRCATQAYPGTPNDDETKRRVNDDQDVEAESVTQRVTNYRMGVHKYKSEKHQKFKHSEEMALLP